MIKAKIVSWTFNVARKKPLNGIGDQTFQVDCFLVFVCFLSSLLGSAFTSVGLDEGNEGSLLRIWRSASSQSSRSFPWGWPPASYNSKARLAIEEWSAILIADST